ncbi:MAG TPA: hypothetical protein VMY35_02495 [Phycisphaerae bacterium]|nr:hypothetical protein [Phycisphaerae bacterium]
MAYKYVSSDSTPDRYTKITGEDIAAGDMVAIDPVADVAMIANAIVGANQQAPACGIAETAVASGGFLEIKRSGIVAGCSGLTPGHPVFLGETDGAVTSTEPSTTGDIQQAVGQAMNATTFALGIGSGDYAVAA